MLNQDKINKVKGILSAKGGTLIPKFLNPSGPLREKEPMGYNEWCISKGNFSLEDYNKYLREFKETEDRLKSVQSSLDPKIDSRQTLLEKISEGTVSNEQLQKAQAVTISTEATPGTVLNTETSTKDPVTNPVITDNAEMSEKAANIEELQKQLRQQTSGGAPKLTMMSTLNSTFGTYGIEDNHIENLAAADAAKAAEEARKAAEGSSDPQLIEKLKQAEKEAADATAKAEEAGKVAAKNNALKGVGVGIDMASNLFVDKSQFASDDPTQGKGRQIYDSIANAAMGFSPVGTIVGGAMKAVGLVNDVFGSRADSFSKDTQAFEMVGGSYGGTEALADEAVSKSGKKYGLFSGSARRRANRLIAEAKTLQGRMRNIAENAADRKSMATLAAQSNGFSYKYQMNGGYDLRYMRAAKSGAKINYFKEPFKVNLTEAKEFYAVLTDKPPVFKYGGTILDLLDNLSKFEIVLSEPSAAEILKKGGTIKDREIEVIETNTTLKSVIPEGALHKNKHHLDTVGVDDSELTKKGIPVVDNEGDLLAEIELNEIIFTLEVTKELESRYKEFYAEGTSESKKDELAIETGKLLWKEILYNTDDRTGLIDTLKLGGTISSKNKETNEERGKRLREEALKYSPNFINRLANNDLRGIEVEGKLGSVLLNTGSLLINIGEGDKIYGLVYPSIQEINGNLTYVGKDNWKEALKNHDVLFFDNPEDATWFGENYKKYIFPEYFKLWESKYNKPHVAEKKYGGQLTLSDIDKMVKQALINILTL